VIAQADPIEGRLCTRRPGRDRGAQNDIARGRFSHTHDGQEDRRQNQSSHSVKNWRSKWWQFSATKVGGAKVGPQCNEWFWHQLDFLASVITRVRARP